MRQIKFRAWDKHGEIFRTEFYINFDGVLYYNSSIGIKKCTEDNYVLNQFTGLLDKNGKEIYQGDIMKFLDENWLVIYFEQYASFMLQKGNDLANITTQEEKIDKSSITDPSNIVIL